MPRLKSLTALALLTAACLVCAPAQAVSILWVDSVDNGGSAGRAPEASWITLLETNGGHTVTTFDTSQAAFNLNTQADIDYVESFDLAIVFGSNAVFNAVRGHGAKWNALGVPIINTGMYLAGGLNGAGSWDWHDRSIGSGTVPGLGAGTLFTVGDASDPIWDNVTLGNGDTETPSLYQSGSRYMDINGNTLKPGITALATNPSDSEQIAIAYATAGALRPGGAAQYFIASATGSADTPEPFTADGEQVFLDAIDALTGGGGVLGDFDGDGDVDGVDIAEMFSNFNGPGGGVPTNPATDLDGDGDVDGVDIAALFGAFTGPLAPATVPEPTSLALLGLGGLVALRRRR